MAAKAQSKHENFVNKTSTAIGYTIIGLDYYIEDYKVTLRQAIMSIRSTTEPEYNLFTAVDDMSYSNKVVFAFRKSFEAEAAAAIPGLPLIFKVTMASKYGPGLQQKPKQRRKHTNGTPTKVSLKNHPKLTSTKTTSI